MDGTQRVTVLGFIDDAIPKAEGERTDIARIPDEYAQKALDVVWQVSTSIPVSFTYSSCNAVS